MSVHPRTISGREPGISGWDRGFSRHQVVERFWWTALGRRGKWKPERVSHPAHWGLHTFKGRRKGMERRARGSTYNYRAVLRNAQARFAHIQGPTSGRSVSSLSVVIRAEAAHPAA